MQVKLNIEYSAEASEPDETAADEEKALDVIRGSVEQFISLVRRSCEEEGLRVKVER